VSSPSDAQQEAAKPKVSLKAEAANVNRAL